MMGQMSAAGAAGAAGNPAGVRPPYSERLADRSCAIFLLHGVVPEARDPVRNYNRKHIESGYFRDFLRDLAGRGRALSMDQVLEICEAGGEFPDRSFALTFDDGFENNLSVAAPILEAMGLPATFYVTSRFVDENGMSWIDRIEAVLEDAPPGSLRFPWADSPRGFRTPADKVALLDEVRRVVKGDPGCDTEALVADLSAQLGREPIASGRGPLDLKLTWEQVGALAARPLFTVGGHSHTHRILSFLAPDDLERDIGASLSLLREKGGVESAHYSYPEGLEHCYSEAVIARLRRGGIRCCPTAVDGLNRRGADPFRLRRIMVS
jgi:peptidoglycan/xylan/chitin deacetylase (PgdA/CDA1 family)